MYIHAVENGTEDYAESATSRPIFAPFFGVLLVASFSPFSLSLSYPQAFEGIQQFPRKFRSSPSRSAETFFSILESRSLTFKSLVWS